MRDTAGSLQLRQGSNVKVAVPTKGFPCSSRPVHCIFLFFLSFLFSLGLRTSNSGDCSEVLNSELNKTGNNGTWVYVWVGNTQEARSPSLAPDSIDEGLAQTPSRACMYHSKKGRLSHDPHYAYRESLGHNLCIRSPEISLGSRLRMVLS